MQRNEDVTKNNPDPSQREQQNAKKRDLYRNDEEYRKKMCENSKLQWIQKIERSRNDPEYKKKIVRET
jgi:hypothetical protein